MAFRCTEPALHPVKTLAYESWTLTVKPSQMPPRTWYVAGQAWMGRYLVDTGSGLILIDAAIPESTYLLVDSIYRLRYKLEGIKKIPLSHAHFDHCGTAGAMKELTGASVYLSLEDYEFYWKCPKKTLVLDPDSHPQDFVAGVFCSDEELVILGDIPTRIMLTPGHIIGYTSFSQEEKNPVNRKTYMVAMHGGTRANTTNDDYCASSTYLVPDLRTRFLRDAEELKGIYVDIALPSHPNQTEIVDRAGQYAHKAQPYLDDTVRAKFIEGRTRQVRELMK